VGVPDNYNINRNSKTKARTKTDQKIALDKYIRKKNGKQGSPYSRQVSGSEDDKEGGKGRN